jgi:PAS domain S-box-containing protein
MQPSRANVQIKIENSVNSPDSSPDFQKLFEAERMRADRLEAELILRDASLVESRQVPEEALRKQWRAFDTALSNTPDFNYIFDLDGRFTYINRALLALWQRSLEESVGKNFYDLGYPPGLAERLQRQIQEVIDTKEVVRDETPYTGADGNLGYYEYIFVPVLAKDGSVVAVTGSTRDVTHQKRIERALRESQERIKQIFEQAPLPIVVFRGRDFVIELANPYYHALLRGRELEGRTLAEAMPELGRHVWDALRGVFESGRPFLANEWLIPYDPTGSGEVVDAWFNVVYHALHELDGSIGGVMAVAYDVSAQLRARQTLERANKDLEEFAYVASHDLQEPLRMVNVFTELLLKDLGRTDADELERYAGFIKTGVRRMQTLLQELLLYSQTRHVDDEPAVASIADLNRSLAIAAACVESRIAESGAIMTADSLPLVVGDEGQLAHVFQNLLSNALKYRKPDVTPHIHIAASRKGGLCEIRFQDNGIGFHQEYAERIFGLFKRLHRDEQYPGTGLGLAISRRIVERYGGKMWAAGVEGEGATFYFSLELKESS